MKKHLSLFLLLSCSVAFSQTDSLFEKGKQFYKSASYTDAIAAWESLLENNLHSEALYYNLGNAHYKIGAIGPSIYYYEKALQLNPKDAATLNNLQYAKNARIDAIEPLPQTVFAKTFNRIAGIFSLTQWAWLTVGGSFLICLFFIGYLFSTSTTKKRVLFISSVVCLLFWVGLLAITITTNQQAQSKIYAIVFASQTKVNTEPLLNAATLFNIHEGTKVQVLETEGDWVQIKLANGNEGWILKTDITTL